MSFGEGRVETVTEDVNQLLNPTEMKGEHWKGKTVFQLKVKRPLKRNTRKGPVRRPEVSIAEPTDKPQDKATHDIDESPYSLPHTVDDARQITDRLLAHKTWYDQQFRILLLSLFQTPDPQTGDVTTADRWFQTHVA